MKDKESDLSKEDVATLNSYRRSLDNATKFIPFWVKIAVAIALLRPRHHDRLETHRGDGRGKSKQKARVSEEMSCFADRLCAKGRPWLEPIDSAAPMQDARSNPSRRSTTWRPQPLSQICA
jgi:hypothetical protein